MFTKVKFASIASLVIGSSLIAASVSGYAYLDGLSAEYLIIILVAVYLICSLVLWRT